VNADVVIIIAADSPHLENSAARVSPQIAEIVFSRPESNQQK
jgi:hypothetical protein